MSCYGATLQLGGLGGLETLKAASFTLSNAYVSRQFMHSHKFALCWPR